MPDRHSSGSRYRDAGVDITAGNSLVENLKPIAHGTRRPGCMADIGGFGALFDLKAAGFTDPILVSTTDGVGTKVMLASRYGGHRGIGIDLVAMCVNDLVVQAAQPLFFLDYFATGRLSQETALEVLDGIAAGCKEAGCALIGGETAEMPGLYEPGHYDLAGFAVGAVERGEALPKDGIAPGDVLLGLSSSGIHSNGFSLVRLIIDETAADLAAPASFAPTRALGEALLAPTRIYVKGCLAALQSGAVKAMAHITGGGLVENLPRVLPDGCIAEVDTRAWPLPPVFGWLATTGRLKADDLARTFNNGIGMVLVVDPVAAPRIAALLSDEGETVHTIGVLSRGVGPARVKLLHAETTWPTAAA